MIKWLSIQLIYLKSFCNFDFFILFRASGYSDYLGKLDPDYISSFMMEKSRMTPRVVDKCEEVEQLIHEKVEENKEMLAIYYDVDSAPNFQLKNLMGYEQRAVRPDRKRNL